MLIPFLQKCSSIQYCVSSFFYSFRFMLLHLHCHSLCFHHHCIYVVCHTSNYTFVYSCSFATLQMNIRSTDVAPSLICFLTCQRCLLLHKNSTIDVLVVQCFELSSLQTTSFHYTPSLVHIPKMVMNATMTLQATIEYSTHLLYLLFLTPLLLLFFTTIPLPPLAFVYAHSFVLPFPLLFSTIFQWKFVHSCYYEFQNFENTHNFQQQM